MAIRYFDRNGTVAGFGTLNGNWDTTLSYWSTSSAGTSSPTAYTFTAEDTAQFGFTGTSAIAGTVTITVPLITLNKLVTSGGLGTQIITRTSTNQLNLVNTSSGVLPILDMGTGTGGIRFQTPVGGTSGFVKEGGSFVYFETPSSISGNVTINQGFVIIGYGLTGTPSNLESISSYNITTSAGAAGLGWQGGTAHSFDKSFTGPEVQSTDAYLAFYNNAGTTLADNTSVISWKGNFYLQADAGGVAASAIVNVIPINAARIWFRTYQTGSTERITNFTLASSGGTVPVPVILEAQAAGTGTIHTLTDNSSGATSWTGSASLLNGSNSSAIQTLRLSGTNNNSVFNSNIIQNSGLGTLAINKSGAGKWTLTEQNTYGGTTSINNGILSAQNDQSFGPSSTGDITQFGGTIEISNNIIINKGTRTLTLQSSSGANAIQVPVGGGNNTIICGSIPLATSATVNFDIAQGASLTLQNSNVMSGGSTVNAINKKGGGELNLGSTANNFTGSVVISDGTLTAGNIQASGTNSSLGAGNSIQLSGTLKYNGTSPASTNRSIFFTGPLASFDASGTGHISYNSTISHNYPLSKTLTFKGTNTGSNHFASALSDASQPTSIVKEGVGRWAFTDATVNYTGLTTITEGALDYGDIPRTLAGNISMSGGVLENGTSTIESNVTMTGGRVTAIISGAKNIAVNSNTATLYPASASNNEYSGTTTISAGATVNLFTDATPSVAGTGRVLGTSDVTVNGDIVTGYSLLQKGQMRYGGDLTFNAGSKLRIGGAAVA